MFKKIIHNSSNPSQIRVRQIPEEGRRTYQPKRSGNNDEDSSPKALNDKMCLQIIYI